MPNPSHYTLDLTNGTDRLTALGAQLIEIHDTLRDDLDDLRAALDDFMTAPAGDPPLTRRLRDHCVAFCAAVGAHHTDEDVSVFPLLAQRFPDLAPVAAQLERDHSFVAHLLGSLDAKARELVDSPDEAARRRLRGDVEGLSAVLESHLAYEERVLVPPLDALRAS